MSSEGRERAFGVVLKVVGFIFIFGLLPLTMLWPDGFMWEPRQSEYEHMILVTFAVLGLFLVRASGEPSAHRSLISFAGWSSLIHGGLMLTQALRDPMERANLLGDVPALILIGAVLLVMNRPTPSGSTG